MRFAWFACAALAVSVVPVGAQDAATAAAANYTVLAENARVRVLRGTLAAGARTVMHEHPAHLAVSLSPASASMTTGDGKAVDVVLKAEEVSLMPAGTHAVLNTGAHPLDVVIVELKGEPGTGTLLGPRPGTGTTTLLDGPDFRAARVTFEPSFKEPAGSTHDFHQVVIMLEPSDISLTMDGKAASTWKRGDVRLIGKGAAHETTAGKQMGDAIIVSIK